LSNPDESNWIAPEVLSGIRQQFFAECSDHISVLEAGLLELSAGHNDWEIINTIFRAAHSIKGGAATFGVEGLQHFAHELESPLARFREHHTFPSPAAIKVLLHAIDLLADMTRAALDGGCLAQDQIDSCVRELSTIEHAPIAEPASQVSKRSGSDNAFEDIGFVPAQAEFVEIASEPQHFRVRFRPHGELYARANDPLPLLRALKRLGEAEVTLDADSLPLLSELDHNEGYLFWTIDLLTAHDEAQIREVFEFVEQECELEIVCISSVAPAPENSLSPQKPEAPPQSNSPVPTQTPTSKGTQLSSTLRVNLDRLDRLMNLVSELVISEATLCEYAPPETDTHPNFPKALDDIKMLTRDLQESVMAIRAQPVRTVFQRLPRLVRDIEMATGKEVHLVMEGEDTEVDRTLIEGLNDPLTHMIRNAIDHGIEDAATRVKAGKSQKGLLRVSAAHRAGRLIVEITDDGQGLDRERIRSIAVERGVIGAEDVLSNEEIDSVIFQPGFSTSEKVTDISGRGVGLDVVNRSVQALGGRIAVSSRPGLGTTFSLSLPLTLAVLDGMLVSVCAQGLVVPLTNLLETVPLSTENLLQLGANTELLAIRGRHVPLVDLGALFEYRPPAPIKAEGVAVLVEADTGQQIALIVDDILDQRQVVIKALDIDTHPMEGIAAATVLGNGRVALILDINAIVALRRPKGTPAERLAADG